MAELRLRLSELANKLLQWRAKSVDKDPSDLAYEILRGRVAHSPWGFYHWMVGLHLNWPWPRWIRSQTSSDLGHAWDVGMGNRTRRSWAMTALPSMTREFLVDLDGTVMLGPAGPSVSLWVREEGILFSPEDLDPPLQELDLETGGVRTRWSSSRVSLEQHVLPARLGPSEAALVRVHGTGLEAIYLSVRPACIDAIRPLRSLRYDPEARVLYAEGKPFLVLGTRPRSYGCGSEEGDVAGQCLSGELNGTTEATSDLGWATAAFEFSGDHEMSVEFAVVADVPVKRWNWDSARERARAEWSEVWERVPFRALGGSRVERALLNSIAYLVMLTDDGRVTAGPTIYHWLYVRDGVYMATALLASGLVREAGLAIRWLFSLQSPDGSVTPIGGVRNPPREWDALGQIVWALRTYSEVTGDWGMAEELYPAVVRAVSKIVQLRGETSAGEDLIRGLLPPSFSAEDTGPVDYIYWDDAWALRGLRDAVEISERLGKGDEGWISEEAAELEESLRRSIELSSARSGVFFPTGPLRGVDSGILRNQIFIWPTGVFDPKSQEAGRLLDTIDRFFVGGGAYHVSAWGQLGSYITMDVALSNVLVGRVKRAAEMLEWVLSVASPTWGWAEGHHPITLEGGQGDQPHGWAAADFVHLIRNSLVREEGSAIHLLSLAPEEACRELLIERLPSTLGAITVSGRLEGTTLRLEVDPGKAERIVVHPVLGYRIEDVKASGGSLVSLSDFEAVLTREEEKVKVEVSLARRS